MILTGTYQELDSAMKQLVGYRFSFVPDKKSSNYVSICSYSLDVNKREHYDFVLSNGGRRKAHKDAIGTISAKPITRKSYVVLGDK